ISHHGGSVASTALGYFSDPEKVPQPAKPVVEPPSTEQESELPTEAPPKEPEQPQEMTEQAPEAVDRAAGEEKQADSFEGLQTLVAGCAGWGVAFGRRESRGGVLAQEELQRFSVPRLRSWRWNSGRLSDSEGEGGNGSVGRLVQRTGFMVEMKEARSGRTSAGEDMK
ncbi:MAG: hypothetical protein GX751_02040, partial [Desulfuromonadaceae bacterium]|nr:hypothetical protein [Desulfuromonadaceae bacterium]